MPPSCSTRPEYDALIVGALAHSLPASLPDLMPEIVQPLARVGAALLGTPPPERVAATGD